MTFYISFEAISKDILKDKYSYVIDFEIQLIINIDLL